MNQHKKRYIEHCQNYPISVFSQYWWLDATAGFNNWDVVMVERDGMIVATLPYYSSKMMGFNVLEAPIFTPYLGVNIIYPDDLKSSNYISYEKKILTELIEKIPDFHYFKQSFSYKITNWLPFYWKGFKQTTKYTYVIEDIQELDSVFKNFKSNVRRNIKKAEKNLIVKDSDDIEKLENVINKTFARQNIKSKNSLEQFKKLDDACKAYEARKILLAEDDSGRVHAGIYLVWDKESVFYLRGGGDPELRNSGAHSLLFWKGIQFAAQQKLTFDFEGSMIEPIENFFRTFGASQKPYHRIYKINSLPLRIALTIKDK